MLKYILLCLLFISTLYSQSSKALYITKNQQFIYSANLDAGSVSKTSLKTKKLISELILGEDLRRLAFNEDETLYAVSDYAKNLIYIVDVKKDKRIKTIKTPSKPHAIIYDKNKKVFYATSFEDNKVFVIDEKNLEIIQEVKTLETPRGLALTKDGRLLVSHALLGKVSIFKIIEKEKPLDEKAITIISLHETQNEDEKVSQGLPRYLDDIEITPDGSEAWLPHMLWNLDHKFQFQSSVFPTISIIDLTPYNERELEIKRKHLFKEINITNNLNKTLIISNPWDLVFAPNGDKAYVTLAGSEDILVMDLKRSTQNKKRKSRQHRIRKKRAGSGARAVQILRNAGSNPRAIIISKDGNDIYVQNAMSLTLSKFYTGGQGSFARLRLKDANFVSITKHDPLDKKMRKGKTLFNLANSSTNKNRSMSGDFWMACASCHYEGFNGTNRFNINDAKVNKSKDAVRGHRNLTSFFTRDFISDYVKIIQQTQGGYGAEKEEGIKKVDGQNVSDEIRKDLLALHAYVQAPENLPSMSTWLKIDDKKRIAHKKEWLNSASCKACHPVIFKQWANSSHGTGMDHSYYEFQENIAAKKEGEGFRRFCRGCHVPQAILTGVDSLAYKFQDNMHEKNAQSLQDAFKEGKTVVEAGTSCFLCHRINKAANAGGNADFTVNLKDRKEYFFTKSTKGVKNWINNKSINANPSAHKASYSNKELYQDSLYCATCHNEFVPGTGVKINDNYGEWLNSSFNNPKDSSKHKTCIDCHMKADISKIGEDVPGYSTLGGELKKDVRTHHFTGANYYLAGLKSQEHKKLSIDLLRIATKLDATIKDDKLIIRVSNVMAGHKFPGGARRQVWLEVTVKDKNGSVVFKNGHMKGDEKPTNAREIKKSAGKKDGSPVGLHFWRKEMMIKDTRIPADGFRDEVYDLPKNIKYPLKVQTRLMFRAFAKGLTNKVRKAFPKRDIPYAKVIQINTLSKVIDK